MLIRLSKQLPIQELPATAFSCIEAGEDIVNLFLLVCGLGGIFRV
jgi:hypothetical protein